MTFAGECAMEGISLHVGSCCGSSAVDGANDGATAVCERTSTVCVIKKSHCPPWAKP